jgi:hypothetical protein
VKGAKLLLEVMMHAIRELPVFAFGINTHLGALGAPVGHGMSPIHRGTMLVYTFEARNSDV